MSDYIKVKNRDKFANFLFGFIVAESILGGAGRIIAIGPLTLRYVLFAFAMLYFAVQFLQGKTEISKGILCSMVLFFGIYFFSVFVGLLKNPIGNVLEHSKSYLFIFMCFPFMAYLNSRKRIEFLLKIVNISTTILAYTISIIFVAVYFRPSLFDSINTLLLDQFNMGFLSQVGNGLVRVFFKACPYTAIVTLYRFYRLAVNRKIEKKGLFLLNTAVLIFSVIVSFTMGLWLSFFVGAIILIFLLPKKARKGYLLTGLIFLILAFLFFGNMILGILSSRLSGSDASGIIKAQQFEQVIGIWETSPIIGIGFGKEITYISEVAVREMLTIENTWLEILMTMGVVGFVTFLFFLCNIISPLFKSKKILKNNELLRSNMALIVVGIAIIVVLTYFNPFINNPIGLSFVSLSCGIANYYATKMKKSKDFEAQDSLEDL